MTERHEEIPQERVLFPITATSVERTLHDLRENVIETLNEEARHLEQNPVLSTLLHSAEQLSPNPEEFAEGVLFCHAIIRRHTERNANSFPPVITKDNIGSLLQSRTERLKARESGQQGFIDRMNQEMQAITEIDPAFGNGIQEIVAYRRDRSNLYFGVIETYRALRAPYDATVMNANLKK